MDNTPLFKQYAEFISYRPERYGKATLFEDEHILVGLNCLKPGQLMEKHAHQEQIRFYLVLEGHGVVWVGEDQQQAGPGMAIWVPVRHTHRIQASEDGPMILLAGIVPPGAD